MSSNISRGETSQTSAKISSRLYSSDLAPLTQEGRQWGIYSVFTLWMNVVHSLGNYTFAIGLFALGLNVWQILITFAIGALVLFVILTFSGFIGEKTGLPFPVLGRMAFGVHGGILPTVGRGISAIAWFGIQTYLAAGVLVALLSDFIPALSPLENTSFLGLSILGWIAFMALWVVQIIIVSMGMGMVRKAVNLAGPIVLITMLGLAFWVFAKADFHLAYSNGNDLPTGQAWMKIFSGAALWVVIFGTFALNISDFTRGAKDKKSITIGNIAGLLFNNMLFAVIVIALAGGQYYISGHIIESPTDIVRAVDQPIGRIAASLSLIILTIAVNLAANFVAPIYMLVSLAPRLLNFKTAAWVSAVLGLIILPWNLYDSPVVIEYFLGGLGAILGPFFGIFMIDYWLIRRQKVNVPDLYTEDPQGTYYYRRGFNMVAVIALIPSAIISVALSLAPMFHTIANFSWFIGALLAALIYWALSPSNKQYKDVSGEPIARTPE